MHWSTSCTTVSLYVLLGHGRQVSPDARYIPGLQYEHNDDFESEQLHCLLQTFLQVCCCSWGVEAEVRMAKAPGVPDPGVIGLMRTMTTPLPPLLPLIPYSFDAPPPPPYPSTPEPPLVPPAVEHPALTATFVPHPETLQQLDRPAPPHPYISSVPLILDLFPVPPENEVPAPPAPPPLPVTTR